MAIPNVSDAGKNCKKEERTPLDRVILSFRAFIFNRLDRRQDAGQGGARGERGPVLFSRRFVQAIGGEFW
jgi:hypothetical protein